jgi:hypothetical protein
LIRRVLVKKEFKIISSAKLMDAINVGSSLLQAGSTCR